MCLKSSMPKLKYSEVTCPICLCMLIEPVTLPCKHEMCLVCFQRSIQSSNIACPLCRLRISSWSRRAAREKCLVNIDRWNEIRRAFPEKTEKRLAGEDDGDTSFEGTSNPVPLSKPGEIRKEYEEKLLEFQIQEALIRHEEERASEELIKKIQCEEMQKFPLSCEQNSTSSHIRENIIPGNSSSGCFTEECNLLISSCKGKKKPRSSSAESGDSIRPELQYFKPIKAAPKTPPKRRADGQLVEAPVMCIKPRKLMYNPMPSAGNSSHDFVHNKMDITLNDTDEKNAIINNIFSPKEYRDSCRQDNQPLHTLSLNSPSLLIKKVKKGFSGCCVEGGTSKNFSSPDQNLVVSTHSSTREKASIISLQDYCSENNSLSEGVSHFGIKLTSNLHRSDSESKIQGSSEFHQKDSFHKLGKVKNSSSTSKNTQGSLIIAKSQMPSFYTCGNIKSSSKLNNLKEGKPSTNILDTAAANEKNQKIVGCMKCKLNSVVISSEKNDLINICDFHSASKSQIKKDFDFAMHLQEKYDKEARKFSTCSLKSDYNLRNRCMKVKYVSK